MSAGVDRHKGARKQAQGLRRVRDVRDGLDQAYLLKGLNAELAHHKELELINELLGNEGVPDDVKAMVGEWKAWLTQSGKHAHLSPSCAGLLRGKYFRYITMKGAEPPANWTPKQPPRRRSPKPQIADFLRDPALLPKKPPTRRTT